MQPPNKRLVSCIILYFVFGFRYVVFPLNGACSMPQNRFWQDQIEVIWCAWEHLKWNYGEGNNRIYSMIQTVNGINTAAPLEAQFDPTR